jgi:hypothetical protein
MRHPVIALFLFASAYIQVSANENRQSDINLLDELSSEYAVCSAYSTVIQTVLVNAGDTDTAEKYSLQSKLAYQYAKEYANQGRTIEMAKKVTLSRIQTHLQAMTEEIGDDASNISILVNRHSYKCKQAMVEPEAFGRLFQVETHKMD